MKHIDNCTVVDIFCGAGGLTHGFVVEGFQVAAGVDADPACRYPYETNNPGAKFIDCRIENLSSDEIKQLYPPGHVKILVGCAPCQPFSSYNQQKGERHDWDLLYAFANLIGSVEPDIVSMENVPRLATYDDGKVYKDFMKALAKKGYNISSHLAVNTLDYGVPQHRKRLVLLASRWGKVELLNSSHSPDMYRTVRDTIQNLPPLKAGEISPEDPLHRASRLSELNLQRIRASAPGGTWLDWDDDLRAECHMKESGKFYKSVYARMAWDEPAPTITTQCSGFGNGRFGHPSQDRAISLREAALLQTFPKDYEFFAPSETVRVSVACRLIGNAVPVTLARVIAKSVRLHVLKYRGRLTNAVSETSLPCQP